MQRAHSFLYVCAGIFLLALAYHLGAGAAQAQFGTTPIGFTSTGAGQYVMTQTGDVFYRPYSSATGYSGFAVLVGNFWDAPTPVKQSSFGAVKARYR